MFKKSHAIVLILQLSGALAAQESMQELFNKSYEQIDAQADNENMSKAEEAVFKILQTKLDKFVKDGGDINEFFLHPEDENCHNLTMLMFAAQNGNVKLVKYLLNKGANPLVINNQGFSIFYYMAVKLISMCYWASPDTEEALLKSLDVFAMLLDVIDVKEHKNIFKNWVLCFKYLDDQEFDTLIESEDFSLADEWKRASDSKLIIGFGITLLEFVGQSTYSSSDIFNSSAFKILQHFAQTLSDADKKIVYPVMHEYLKGLYHLSTNNLKISMLLQEILSYK